MNRTDNRPTVPAVTSATAAAVPASRACLGLAVACLVIAATGIPAAVVVALWGAGTIAAAGATAIGTISVAALGAARHFLSRTDYDDA